MPYIVDPISGNLVDTAGLSPDALATIQGFLPPNYAGPGGGAQGYGGYQGLPGGPSGAAVPNPNAAQQQQNQSVIQQSLLAGLTSPFGMPGAAPPGAPAVTQPSPPNTAPGPGPGAALMAGLTAGQGYGPLDHPSGGPPTPDFGPSLPTNFGPSAPTSTNPSSPAAVSATPAVPRYSPVATPTSPVAAPQTTAALTTGAAQGAIDPNAPYTSTQRDAYRTAIFGPESGFDPNAKNPKSSASGLGQFTGDTFRAFIESPQNKALGEGQFTVADKNKPAAQTAATDWLADQNAQTLTQQLKRPATFNEVGAAHLLGSPRVAAFAANPNANAYQLSMQVSPRDTDATFSNNGSLLNKNMTGAQALQSVGGHFFGRGQGTQVASASPQVATDATPGAGTTPAQPQGGGQQQQGNQPNLYDFSRFLNPADYPLKPSTSDQMLALASGLLSTKPGGGLGEGISNLLGLRQQYRENALHAGSTAATLANMGVMANYHAGMLDNATGRLGVQKANSEFRTSGAASLTPMAIKENFGEKAELENGGDAAAKNLTDITNIEKLLETNKGVVGPDVAAQTRRWVANRLGIQIQGEDPTGAQLMAQIANQQKTGQLSHAWRGLGLRNLAEFNTFISGIPSPTNMNPQAFKIALDLAKRDNQFHLHMFNDWNQLGPDGQTKLLTQVGGVSNWSDQRKLGYYQQLGLDPDDSGGGAQSQVNPTPGGGYQVAPLKPLSSFQR